MDKLKIRKEIAALIDGIKEHSNRIGDKDVPPAELELFLRNIEKLYEKAIVHDYLCNLSETKPAETIIKQEIKAETKTPANLFGEELPPPPEKPKKTEKAPVSKLQKPPLSDLKSAIGINDQFQFANELFEGSMQEYGIAIQQLNTAESLESAIDYFGNLQQLYNWDEKNETAKRLLELVDRRYSS